MRLKSTHASAANQRIKRTCVAIFMLYLLSAPVWSYANIKHHRFVRQLNAEKAVNYEDTAMTNLYHQPHFTGNRAVVVQLFEWKFVDVAAECRNFLGPQGYAGVQLSPVLEHTVIKTSELNHPWWERYEVVSYRLASRSGDESEFWSMSRICNEHGVRIYADVILNHMAAPLHFVGVNETENEDFIINTLLETNVNISQLNYSNVSYTHLDFHHPLCIVLANAQDAHEIRNCQMNGHPDLDHSNANVQKHIVEMLNKFIDMGVAGFRIDTAKYMWPIDLKNILKQVKNLNTEFNFKNNLRPFVYHDVFDLGLDAVSKTEYSTYGLVSEYLYPAELATVFNGKIPLSSLINWGPAMGFLPHDDSLVFIDSHDSQRGLPLTLGNNHMLTYKKRFKYIMANVFMLVHPYGAIKRIMSSYYFPDTNINQGPPVEDANEEEIISPKLNEHKQCTKDSGWVCEHRWPEIVNMLKVANYFKVPENKEESVIYFQTNGPNQVAFCRGHKAFVAINNDAENDFVKEVHACLEPGVYCDVITGGKKEDDAECHGKMLEINEHGIMKLELAVADNDNNGVDSEVNNEGEEELGKIESYGIIVIYVETKIKPKEKLPSDKNDEEFQTDEKAAEANEIQFEVVGKDIDTPNTNDIEDTEVDKTESKENEEQINDDDSKQNDEEDNEDMGNPNNTEDEINTEQPEENVSEEEEKEETEGSAAAAGNDLEEVIDKTVEEKIQENEKEEIEDVNEVSDVSKENDLNENDKEEKQEETEQSIENVEPEENADETKNEDNNVEVPEENSSNEKEVQDSIENNKEDIKTDDIPKEVKAEQGDVAETEAENIEEELKIELDSAKDAEKIQSRNLEDTNIEAEEQLEKPSAEIVDDFNASDAVTAKVQDIQTVGIFSKPKGDGNNG